MFKPGTNGYLVFGVSSVQDSWMRFEQSSFYSGSYPLRTAYGYAEDGAYLELLDCTIDLNGGYDIEARGGHTKIIGGTILNPSDTCITSGGSYRAIIELIGVDLSAFGAGDYLVDVTPADPSIVRFRNCKLGSGVAITTGTPDAPAGMTVEVVNCDSADTNYAYAYRCHSGAIDHETTIVRTGGASDGTTAISRRMAANANATYHVPLVLESLAVWNETIGSSVTVTVHVVTDNVTLQDDEAWVEVEYLGTSGYPIATIARDRMTNILSTPANQAASTETWTTTGLTTPIKQQFSVDITPQEKGVIRARVVLAKPSTNMYVCPKLELS